MKKRYFLKKIASICLLASLSLQTSLPGLVSAIAAEQTEDINLEILNVHSHPKQGENWEVSFETSGRADLTITPEDQATIDDLDFMSLSCNGEERKPEIKEGGVLFYPDWECSVDGEHKAGIGLAKHLVNKAGKHTLKFRFEDQEAFAYNSPLFNITHEANNLDEYGSTVEDNGDLSAHTDAALASTSYGLKVVIDDANEIYGQVVQLDTGTDEVRVRFYADPNGITLGAYDRFVIFSWEVTGNPWQLFTVEIEDRDDGNYYFKSVFYDDNGYFDDNRGQITDVPHYVEVWSKKATNSGSGDGQAEWWIDGVSQLQLINMDNWDTWEAMKEILVGALSIDATTTGTIYLDEIKINDDGSEIGPVPANAAPSVSITLYINESATGAQSEGSNPTAVGDSTPVLSAVYADTDSGDVADYYQLVVYSDGGCSSEVWDSTKTSMTNCTEGNRCNDIDFAGAALSFDGKKYYWKIKYWDDDAAEGTYSDCTANFTILGPGDQMRHGNYFFNKETERVFTW